MIAALISTAGIIETSAHPWLGALFGLGVAAASRGLTRFGIKWRLKGSGYGREEMARDVVVTTVEVMTFFLSRFVPSSLLSKPLDIGARIGLSAFVHHQEIADNDLTPMHAMKVSDMPRLMRLK